MTGFISKLIGFGGKHEEPPEVPTKGNPSDKIQLVSFPPTGQLHSSTTPFGVKIEIMLRLSGLPYEAYPGDVTNHRVAPKGKLPVLFHGEHVVPDSSCILEFLTNTYPAEMARFTPEDALSKALSETTLRMLETRTYFGLLYFIWQRTEFWNDMGPLIFKDVPGALRGTVMRMVRSGILRDLKGQGTGRLTLKEVTNLITADLDTCESLLQVSGSYLSGSTITAADCFLWATLDQIHNTSAMCKEHFPILDIVKSRPGLMKLYNDIKGEVFPNGKSTAWASHQFNPAKDVSK